MKLKLYLLSNYMNIFSNSYLTLFGELDSDFIPEPLRSYSLRSRHDSPDFRDQPSSFDRMCACCILLSRWSRFQYLVPAFTPLARYRLKLMRLYLAPAILSAIYLGYSLQRPQRRDQQSFVEGRQAIYLRLGR